MTSRRDCEALDRRDPLAPLRTAFALDAADADGLVYLDGNSLGALPAATAARVAAVVTEEWGHGLVRSWNTAGWIAQAARVGDKIGRLIGAGPGETIVADSTSVNVHKMLAAAMHLSTLRGEPDRRGIVSQRGNFPTDLYIADAAARERGFELVLVDDPAGAFDARTAVVLLTHVDYRTGTRLSMSGVTAAAHDAGALVVWDLAHSAGAMPLSLHGDDARTAADFAVGCGYKYLNGGPGAPAFLWVHPRHLAALDRDGWSPPLPGWLGHAAPFAFDAGYRPAAGIARFVCGTPPVLSLAALECGVDVSLAAEPYGGMAAVREKSIALTDLVIALVDARCGGHGLTLVTPRAADARGSQVSFAHAEGYAIIQALIARGVIGDFRAPDLLRFGVTPLYTRYVDVWDAVDRLVQVLEHGEWQAPQFAVRAAVT